MGQKLSRELKIENGSGNTLQLRDLRSSCGCTTVTPLQHRVPNGEHLSLLIRLDTHQKLGLISKSVLVYFHGTSAPIETTVSANVLAPSVVHAKVDPQGIFRGDCRICHVDPGLKKTGEGLFLSSCAVCHGSLRQGGPYAPALPPLPSSDLRREVIEKGQGAMPGFSKAHGGPLSPDQIDSLMALLEKKLEPSKEKHPLLIYEEWCLHCHGDRRHGGIGPPIRPQDLKHLGSEGVEKLLLEGLGHPAMPDWHLDEGGVLSSRQIEKLARFLTRP